MRSRAIPAPQRLRSSAPRWLGVLSAGAGAAVLLTASAVAAAGRTVAIPLRLDPEFLRQILRVQLYTGPGGTAEVWRDDTGCNYLDLRDPEVQTREGQIRILTAATAQIGTPVGDACFSPLRWDGYLEILEAPTHRPGSFAVGFRVTDSNVYTREMRKSLVSRTLWDWLKAYVQPRFEAVTIDLQAPVEELRGLLPAVLPGAEAEELRQLLDSLQLESVQVVPEGLRADLRLELPERPEKPPQPSPEPTLSPEELARWEAALRNFDAFLTFVVKHAAPDTSLDELRQALLAVLLDGRHDLLEALAPTAPGSPDPVRSFFVKSWERLAPVMRRLSADVPGASAVRYLSFIAAGDALVALDRAAPELGLEITADGLRRLARMLAPAVPEDPLAYEVGVDPELRDLFGFGPPIPLPQADAATSFRLIAAAWAAEIDRAAIARLNGWVPERDELDAYLPLVRGLLHGVAEANLRSGKIEPKFHQVYRWLVLSTAWQESCWRQFVKQNGNIVPIESPIGSVGLMQVNQRVWRGFYDLQALRRDIGYNGKAGGEILAHYLVSYAIARGEHEKTGSIDNLARATYAAYNGGPGQLTRYRDPKAKKFLRKIDALFWDKYRTVQAGNELAVAQCFGQ